MWQCWRSKNYRIRTGWYDLPVVFIPLNEIRYWTEEVVNTYDKGYPMNTERFLILKENIKKKWNLKSYYC